MTASAHIITAVIGSGVLSLAWAIAQLGWVAGPAVLMAFSFITYFTSTLLADSYRSPDPITGRRNYTYMGVVRAHLGNFYTKTLLAANRKTTRNHVTKFITSDKNHHGDGRYFKNIYVRVTCICVLFDVVS